MLTYIYINLKNQNPNRTSLINLFIFEIKQTPLKIGAFLAKLKWVSHGYALLTNKINNVGQFFSVISWFIFNY